MKQEQKYFSVEDFTVIEEDRLTTINPPDFIVTDRIVTGEENL